MNHTQIGAQAMDERGRVVSAQVHRYGHGQAMPGAVLAMTAPKMVPALGVPGGRQSWSVPMQQPVLAMPSGSMGASFDSRTSTARPTPVNEAPAPPKNTLFLISSTAPGPKSPAPTLEFRMKSIAGAEPGSEICHRIRAFKNDELVSSLLPMPAGCGQAIMFDLEWLGLEHYGDSTWTVAPANDVSPTTDCVAIVLVDDSGECSARNTSRAVTDADLSLGTFTAKVMRGERHRRTHLSWVEREARRVDAVNPAMLQQYQLPLSPLVPAASAAHQPLSPVLSPVLSPAMAMMMPAALSMPPPCSPSILAATAMRQPLSPAPVGYTQRPNPCNSPCNGRCNGSSCHGSSTSTIGILPFGMPPSADTRPQQFIRKKKPKCSSRMAMTLAFLNEGKLQSKPKQAAPARGGYKKPSNGPVPLVRSSSMHQPVVAQKPKPAAPLKRAETWPRGNVLWEPEGAVLMKEELNRMMDQGLHVPQLPRLKDVFCGAAPSPTFIEDLGQDNQEIMEMLQSLGESTHEEDAFDLADCITAEVFGTNPY